VGKTRAEAKVRTETKADPLSGMTDRKATATAGNGNYKFGDLSAAALRASGRDDSVVVTS
jgi:hypothetical protein